jgi:uncharacterized protein with LGFP repeats
MKALLFTLAYGLQSVAAASLRVRSDLGESVQATCSLSTFTKAGLLPQGASIEKVSSVPQNGTYGEGAADLNYPYNPTGLPALCAVTVKVISSNESSYRFGLFLPSSSQWTGRLLAIGNGGFGGGINWLDMYVVGISSILPYFLYLLCNSADSILLFLPPAYIVMVGVPGRILASRPFPQIQAIIPRPQTSPGR